MCGWIVRGITRAVRAIHSRKEPVTPVRVRKFRLDAGSAKPHGVAGQMAGSTGAAVRPQALEKWIIGAVVDYPRAIECRDQAARIGITKQIRNHSHRGRSRNRYQAASYQPPMPIPSSCF